MTEQDILRRQEINGQKEFYLMLVGQFYHAYGYGAFALARASGYRVVRKRRRSGEVVTAGFPVSSLERVRGRIEEHHGELRTLEGGMLMFTGIDGTPDASMISEAPDRQLEVSMASAATCVAEPDAGSDVRDVLARMVRDYNLSSSTPLDAMNFIGQLQRLLRGAGG